MLINPAALLAQARAAEPAMRLLERTAALDRLQRLLDDDRVPVAPAGRDWRSELTAERAIDAARLNQLERAQELADHVLAPGGDCPVATARALEARGRALAWSGTDAATRRADRTLADVADRYAALGEREWQGNAIYWRGNAVYLQNGDIAQATALMRDALDLLGRDSPRRSTVLTFYADALIALGDWPAAEAALSEAGELADRDDDAKSRSYAQWSWARMASARGDAMATERLLREAERDGADWFSMHTGVTFLADAAELLDRVGLTEQAQKYLTRAMERDPDDEFVRQARAALLARTGDPWEAVDALQELARGAWLEKRWVWRHTLLRAWATFRVGREDAGPLAARALEQAASTGGVDVAAATEPELLRALLPLAESAGSQAARRLLIGKRQLLVRVLGEPRVQRADGTTIELPAGKPAELVRLLAIHPYGLSVEVIGDRFFPDVALGAVRNRIRQILARLRSTAGDIVLRDGDRLRLVPAWVDALEFGRAADRTRSSRGAVAVERAYAALVLWGGPPFPTDPYAAWASEARGRLDYQHLTLLDLIAGEADRHGSHQEAITALTAALDQEPHDRDRYHRLADHLLALGRHATARHLAHQAGIDLDDGTAGHS